MTTDIGDLIPDFGPLLSFNVLDHEGLATTLLSNVLPTLRSISRDPSLLSKAMFDYLSLVRDAEIMRDCKKLATECSLLAVKHQDIIVASRAVDSLRLGRAPRTSIHSLPVELIALAFTELTIPPKSKSSEIRSEPFDMQLRSVCRQWKDVIDDTPTLWAYVRLTAPVRDFDQLRVVLGRSKNTPLDFLIHDTYMDEQLYSIISPEIHRARVLIVECCWMDFAMDMVQRGEVWDEDQERLKHDNCEIYVQHLMKNPAPFLMELSMYSLEGFVMPSDAFLSKTPPHFRSLYIYDCLHVSLSGCLFKSSELTRLVIEHCRGWGCIDDILMVLSGLPNLEELQWDTRAFGESVPFNDPDTFGHKSLCLPHLKFLDLYVQTEHVALMFPILDLPTSTQLVIQGFYIDEPFVNSPEFASTLDALHTAFKPHLEALFPDGTVGYDKMSILPFTRGENEDGFSVIMECSKSSPRHSSAPPFNFGVIADPDRQHEYAEVMAQMLTWPGMSVHVVKLDTVHTQFLQEDYQWRLLLISLPALENVSVSGPAVLALFRVLHDNTHCSFTLTLKKISVCSANARTIAFMIRTLDRRVEAGARSLELKLSLCEVEVPVLVQLRLHRGVTAVTWDGREYVNFMGDDDEGISEEDSSEGEDGSDVEGDEELKGDDESENDESLNSDGE